MGWLLKHKTVSAELRLRDQLSTLAQRRGICRSLLIFVIMVILVPQVVPAEESDDRADSKHPYLLADEQRLTELREKFNAEAFADYRRALLNAAKREGSSGQLAPWLYRLTGKRTYLEQALAWMKEEAQKTNHARFRMMAAKTMAIAYDLLYEELPDTLRRQVEAYLDRVVDHYLEATKKGGWFVNDWGNWSNTVAVTAAGGGMAGLAVMHRNARGRKAAERAAKVIAEKYRAIRKDGGCIEGSLYWNFGLTFQLYFAHALSNTIGDEHGLLTREPAPLRRNIHFIHATLGGFGGLIPFNDTQPWLTGAAIMADFGSRFDQPLMRWLADHLITDIANGRDVRHNHENAGPIWLLGAFLWRDRTPAPKTFPGVPTLSTLSYMQWGVMRSSGKRFKPAVVVGVKGAAGEITHHFNYDHGSFTVDVRGVSLLIDPGYYQGEAKDHSVPIIDGVGPQRKGGSMLKAWEEKDRRVALIRSKKAYKKKKPPPSRVNRWVCLLGKEAVVVLDDLLPAAGQPGKVVSRLQFGQPVKSIETAGEASTVYRVAGQGAAARVSLFYPGAIKTRLQARKFGKSWIWDRLAKADLATWTTARISYTLNPRTPLVTVIQPRHKNKQIKPATVQRENGRVRVVLPSGRSILFTRDETRWSVKRSDKQ